MNPSVREKYHYAFYTRCILLVLISFSLNNCKTQNKENSLPAETDYFLQLPVAQLNSSERSFLNSKCSLWYDSVLKNSGFNGGILIAKNGVPVFEKYKGRIDPLRGDSIDSTVPFHIASVSKTFTAMAVLKLWQDKKLNLEDSVSLYLPGFSYPGVTVRSLLNHRSGLPNYAYFMEDLNWDKKDFLTNETILSNMILRKKEIKNIGRPNTYFSYSNTNYALLALIIEKVSGKSYASFLQETFFDPLHMENTYVFSLKDTVKSTFSYDYKGNKIPLDFLDVVYGDKNIYSTPRDLLIWDRALSTNLIFTRETLDEAYTPYSNERPGIKNYGLGWRMNIYPTGKKMIFHNGWWHGNNSVFIRLPAENATIIVLGNKFTRTIYQAHKLSAIFNDYGSEDPDAESVSSGKSYQNELGSQ